MRMIKCENGHVFDADKLKNCPHCHGIIKNMDRDVDTYGKDQTDISTEVSAAKGKDNRYEPDIRKHVAVLVETRGRKLGKSYVLYEGSNLLGRAGNLEVSIDEDTISRSGHAEIVYENGIFTIAAIKRDRAVMVNGSRISVQTELKDRDVIGLGECVFSFIRYDDVY